MLHAIFPSIATMKNVMGEGSALDSGGMIGLGIFWLVTAGFLAIPIPKMKWLVYTKLGVYAVSAIAMLAWCLTLAGGIGPVARQSSTVHGSAKTWLIIRFLFLGMANCATFASNAADFQRYAQKPNDVLVGNIIGFPVSNLLVAIVGNIVGASTQVIFGKLVWNPLTALDMIQTQNYTAGNRAGCFFIALMFAYCAMFSSIFENSLPAGNDIAALLPKYLSVRRGMYLAQVISIAINPWFLLGSASIFISFLASYQIFLSSITGVLLCNYYLVAKGYFHIEDLYTMKKTGAYYYTYGWNIRAYIAYIIGIIPNFYGFLNNMGVHAPIGVTHFYYFAYPVGVTLSAGVFWAMNYFYPPQICSKEWSEPANYIRPEDLNVIEGRPDESEVGSTDGVIVEEKTVHADVKAVM